MIKGQSGGASIGKVAVFSTTNRGHSPEELAEMAMNKLILVKGEIPDPLYDQIMAFKDRLHTLLLVYLEKAQISQMTTDIALAREMGHEILAAHMTEVQRKRARK